jgi:hypothetical protein
VPDRDRHPLGRRCGELVPLVILLMPYALARHGWATWRQRQAKAGRP